MEHSELVGLIRGGIESGDGTRWAELGAGTGAFTAALADLLGEGAHIVAVDRDRGALRSLEERLRRMPAVAFETLNADFTKPLGLEDLDGVLMANSLHFVRDTAPVLRLVRDLLRPAGKLLVVEYDADRGNPWVPHPFSFRTWLEMAGAAGFVATRQVGYRPSRHLGGMYAAVSRRPGMPYPG